MVLYFLWQCLQPELPSEFQLVPKRQFAAINFAYKMSERKAWLPMAICSLKISISDKSSIPTRPGGHEVLWQCPLLGSVWLTKNCDRFLCFGKTTTYFLETISFILSRRVGWGFHCYTPYGATCFFCTLLGKGGMSFWKRPMNFSVRLSTVVTFSGSCPPFKYASVCFLIKVVRGPKVCFSVDHFHVAISVVHLIKLSADALLVQHRHTSIRECQTTKRVSSDCALCWVCH